MKTAQTIRKAIRGKDKTWLACFAVAVDRGLSYRQAMYLADRANAQVRKESYFGNCPRDELGHCKPSGQGDTPAQEKPKSGQRKGKESNASVSVRADEDDAKEALAGLFPGMDYETAQKQLANCVGAPDGAEILVYQAFGLGKADTLMVNVSVKHPDIKNCRRSFQIDKDGNRFIYNEFLEIKKTGTGLGTQIFADQVANATEAGFAYIETTAGGRSGSKLNGYYTWPLLGYDAAIEDLEEGGVPGKAYPDAKTIRDIITSPGGREWWKEHGAEFSGRFDLSEGSVSHKMLDAYLQERAARKKSIENKSNGEGNEGDIPDLSDDELAKLESTVDGLFGDESEPTEEPPVTKAYAGNYTWQKQVGTKGHLKVLLREQDHVARKFRRALEIMFTKMGKRALSYLESKRVNWNADEAVRERVWNAELRKILARHLEKSALIAAAIEWAMHQPKLTKRELREYITKGIWDFLKEMPKKIVAAAKNKVAKVLRKIESMEIIRTVKERVRNSIEDVLGRKKEPPTGKKVADKVKEDVFSKKKIEKQAEGIERTEGGAGIGAGSKAAQEELVEMGYINSKRWMTLYGTGGDDGKVRKAHKAANGQTVGVSEKYIVGGERCDYPGDPVLSPGNRCRCRCVSVGISEIGALKSHQSKPDFWLACFAVAVDKGLSYQQAVYLADRANAQVRKESYFSECPRDELGHCKPSGQGDDEVIEAIAVDDDDEEILDAIVVDDDDVVALPKKSSASVLVRSDIEKVGHEDFDVDSILEEILPNMESEQGLKELASLVGAPDNATVRIGAVGTMEYGDRGEIRNAIGMSVASRDLDDFDVSLGLDRNGRKFIHIDMIKATKPGSGVGRKIFENMVENAIEDGFDYIDLHAAGEKNDKHFNGYYTWPMFGFDESLNTLKRDSPVLVRKVKQEFPAAQSVQDILALPGGREWWKENGKDLFEAKFDLSEGSRSRQVFDQYMARKRQEEYAKES